MDRARPFVYRQMLYEQLDAELAARTRFFAAAALTNSVIARLFMWLPRTSMQHGYQFLNDAGAVLQTVNLRYADHIRQRTTSVTALDQYLILREQKVMQRLLEKHETRMGCQGVRLYREINGLLNGGRVTSLMARLSTCGRRYNRILEKLRCQLGFALDFSNESHRIHIGLGIISHIRETINV